MSAGKSNKAQALFFYSDSIPPC